MNKADLKISYLCHKNKANIYFERLNNEYFSIHPFITYELKSAL